MMIIKTIVKKLPGVRKVVAERNVLIQQNHILSAEVMDLRNTVETASPRVSASDYRVKCFDLASIPFRKD